MITLSAAVLLAATQGAGLGIWGNWCGGDDDAIWLSQEESILGEHAFCRWQDPATGILSHRGVLLCRTSQELHADSVEHAMPIVLSLDASGGLAIDYFTGSGTDTLRPCTE